MTYGAQPGPVTEYIREVRLKDEKGDTIGGAEGCRSDVDSENASATVVCSEEKPGPSATRRRRRQRALARARGFRVSDCPAAVESEGQVQIEKSQLAEEGAVQPDLPREAMVDLRGSVLRLSLDKSGCRVVQATFESGVHPEVKAAMLEELHGHVWDLITSLHGNYVIQKIVVMMPVRLTDFIVHELRGKAVVCARHRFGCRILCRLVEHSSADAATISLVDELLVSAAELSKHTYGHHVVQAILEHGGQSQKQAIIMAIIADLPRAARNTNSTHIIEAILRYCHTADQQAFVASVLNPKRWVT